MVNPDLRVTSMASLTPAVTMATGGSDSKVGKLVGLLKDSIVGPIQRHPYVAGGLVVLASVAAIAYFATASRTTAKAYPDILKDKLDLSGIHFNQAPKKVASDIVASLGERRWKELDRAGEIPHSLKGLVGSYLDPVEYLPGAAGYSLILLGPNKEGKLETFYLEYNAIDCKVEVHQPSDPKVITIESAEELKELFPDFDNTYAIVFAPLGQTIQQKSIELHDVHEKQDVEGVTRNFRHYVAANEEVPTVAPFHHEYQTGASDGKCAMYALNAYIGRNQVGVKSFGEFLVRHYIGTGAATEEEDAEEMVYPVHVGKEGLDKTNLLGADAFAVEAYLKELADDGQIPAELGNSKVISVNTFKKEKLSEKLENELKPVIDGIDRFIFGVGGAETHFMTWRKDENGRWWKIDSLLNEQTSFTAEEALEEIEKDYSQEQGFLYIILPDKT